MIVNNKDSLLLVDDSPEVISVLRAILCDQYAIKIATNGVQALNVASMQRPDIILLDIMMPEMDGYEVCRRLKSDPKTRDIPIIFITALDAAEDEIKGLSLGAVDYLTKPINSAIALARIRTHLELKKQRDELKKLNQLLAQQVREKVDQILEFGRLNLLGKVFDMGHEAVLITNSKSRILIVNKSFLDITGYASDEVVGRTPKMFQSGRHDRSFYRQLWQQLAEFDFWQGEIWSKHKDGLAYPTWLSISAIRDSNRQLTNYIGTFTNINERADEPKKFNHIAQNDSLASLASLRHV